MRVIDLGKAKFLGRHVYVCITEMIDTAKLENAIVKYEFNAILISK
jgi:hypothetical protein